MTRRCEPGEVVDPVELSIEQVCHWKAKPCGECGKAKTNPVHRSPEKGVPPACVFKRKLGCANCGKPKNDVDHLGAPESFNLFASSSWSVYQTAKQRWAAALVPLLEETGLPKGLGHVSVEAVATFPVPAERDQGNFRAIIEKALGDVLEEEGYLPADSWDHYEFGGLQQEVVPGVSRTRLMLFPRAPAVPAPEPEPAALTLDLGDDAPPAEEAEESVAW